VSQNTPLLDVLSLWTTVEPYRKYPSETIGWQLIPAFEHGKIRLYYRGGQIVGFVTWIWLTRSEFESKDYSGPVAFARNSGEVLYVANMIAPYGPSDVFFIARDIRRHLSELYPQAQVAFARRKERIGSYARRD
jgi:hemolysin-activating ACP:hemolysin acyltransferase